MDEYPVEPKNIGERIRKYRIDSGLQVKELAEMLGVTSYTVTNWEKGSSTPSPSRLNLIFSVLH